MRIPDQQGKNTVARLTWPNFETISGMDIEPTRLWLARLVPEITRAVYALGLVVTYDVEMTRKMATKTNSLGYVYRLRFSFALHDYSMFVRLYTIPTASRLLISGFEDSLGPSSKYYFKNI